MRSQCEMRDLWNVEWIQMSVVNALNSRLRSKLRRQIFVSQMYFLFDSRYQIAYRCFILWRIVFRTLHFSNIRSIARSHVLQIDFTSYLKSIDLSGLYSFVFAIFASMYDLALESTALKKSISNDSQSRLFFNRSRVYRVERACSKVSKYASSREFQNSSSKKLAWKLQNTHRWRSSKTRRWKSQNLHRWKSLLENSRHHDICSEQKIQTEDTSECCEKMLKSTIFAVINAQKSVDIIWRKKN